MLGILVYSCVHVWSKLYEVMDSAWSADAVHARRDSVISEVFYWSLQGPLVKLVCLNSVTPLQACHLYSLSKIIDSPSLTWMTQNCFQENSISRFSISFTLTKFKRHHVILTISLDTGSTKNASYKNKGDYLLYTIACRTTSSLTMLISVSTLAQV